MQYILSDLYEAISYVPIAILVGLCGVMLWRCWNCATSFRNLDWKRGLGYWVIVTYGIWVLEVALFSREPGSRTSFDLRLFSTWGDSLQAHAYVIENIIMFIPLGILLLLQWKRMRLFWNCTIVAAVLSLAIECTQAVTQRGHFQTDDIVMNVLGAIVGFVAFKVGERFIRG